MWQSLFSWVRLLWDTGAQTEKNSSRIEALSEAVE